MNKHQELRQELFNLIYQLEVGKRVISKEEQVVIKAKIRQVEKALKVNLITQQTKEVIK